MAGDVGIEGNKSLVNPDCSSCFFWRSVVLLGVGGQFLYFSKYPTWSEDPSKLSTKLGRGLYVVMGISCVGYGFHCVREFITLRNNGK